MHARSVHHCGGRVESLVAGAVVALAVVVACTSGDNDPQATGDGGNRPVVGPSLDSIASDLDASGTALAGHEVDAAPIEPIPGADPIVPTAGNPGYDVREYRWDLDIDPNTGSLRAAARIAAAVTESRDEVVLDYAGDALDDVHVGGVEVDHAYVDDKLILDTAIADGDDLVIDITYDGTPAPLVRGPLRTGWIVGDETVHTTAILPGDMSSILPLNDTPLDPATYVIDITVPASFVATASGQLVGVREADRGSTFEWRVEEPVTEVTLAVGQWVVEEIDAPGLDVALDVALPAAEAVRMLDFAMVPSMVEFVTDRLGPFPFPHLGFTWVPNLGGLGDSTAGRINLASSSESTLVHEVAHQWMGGKIGTASSTDSWLREGFCRYVELVWLEHAGGEPIGAQAAAVHHLLGRETRPPRAVDEIRHRSDIVVYERGALTFHALRAAIGDEQFWAVMRTFFDEYAGRTADSDDFIAVAEQVSGAGLADLFHAWIDESAVPPLPPS